MKVIWRIINSALVVLTAAAIMYLGYMYFQVASFQPGTYTARVEALQAETEAVREDIARIRQDQQAEQDQLSSQLSGLGEDGERLERQLKELRSENEGKAARLAQLQKDVSDAENIVQVTMDMRAAYAASIRQLEEKINAGETDAKICYWSFDDGPSYHTQEVLDFCKENGVFVTFFTSREANDSARDDDPAVEKALLRSMFMNGHGICNHTYSHQYAQYGNVYGMGIDSFREVVQKQDEWITECTGLKADLFRFPGGSSWAFSKLPRAEMEKVLSDLGYRWIDWSCDVYDNGRADPSAHDVYVNAVYEVKSMNIAVVLSHDWNAMTVAGFQRAVPELQQMGYIFLPLYSESWTIDNTTIIFT